MLSNHGDVCNPWPSKHILYSGGRLVNSIIYRLEVGMKAVLVDVYLLVFLYYTSIIVDIGCCYILWSLVTNI